MAPAYGPKRRAGRGTEVDVGAAGGRPPTAVAVDAVVVNISARDTHVVAAAGC